MNTWPRQAIAERDLTLINRTIWEAFPTATVISIAEAWNAGVSSRQMATDLSVKPGTVASVIGRLTGMGCTMRKSRESRATGRPRGGVTGFWTEEMQAECKRLYIVEDLSASEVAKRLGATGRSAVIGIAHRRGWKKAVTVRATGKAAESRYRTHNRARSAAKPKPRLDGLRRFTGAVEGSQPRPWLERTFGECAWPVSGEGADTFSCCAPTKADATLCPGHSLIAYQPRTAKHSERELVRSVRRYA